MCINLFLWLDEKSNMDCLSVYSSSWSCNASSVSIEYICFLRRTTWSRRVPFSRIWLRLARIHAFDKSVKRMHAGGQTASTKSSQKKKKVWARAECQPFSGGTNAMYGQRTGGTVWICCQCTWSERQSCNRKLEVCRMSWFTASCARPWRGFSWNALENKCADDFRKSLSSFILFGSEILDDKVHFTLMRSRDTEETRFY